MSAERVYAAQRLDAGLYLQPSNDGKRWFVIRTYMDGRAHGLERGPELATYWGYEEVSREALDRIQATATYDPGRAMEMIREYGYSGYYGTKREATAAALEGAERMVGSG